jgi:3-phosphoshikimate 1-carboxyvinyltransferase
VNITIQPNFLKGTLQIPSSKSYMQRACAAALLKGGVTHIYNYGVSNDDKAAIAVIQQFGAEITYHQSYLIIESNFHDEIGFDNNAIGTINLGESGLGLRMFTPIAALLKNEIEITGHGSLTKRPMHFFDGILPQLNVAFKSNNGYLPFLIKGKLQPKDITVDGSLSSQFLTGLLMAYSFANKDATITVTNLTSKPYIDITLEVMKSFGLNVPNHHNYESFIFSKRNGAKDETLKYAIESDWSSASFMLVGAAINGNAFFTGLNLNSVQADRKIMEALKLANTKMKISDDGIAVEKGDLIGFEFDATECPDLFPPLVALAANAIGITTIKGLKRLAHKESDRGLTLQEEFAKLGIVIHLLNDEMQIIGNGKIDVINSACSSHNDHRIAMALAVAILNADKAITIENAEAVSKSYPNFFEDLQTLVGTVENRQT